MNRAHLPQTACSLFLISLAIGGCAKPSDVTRPVAGDIVVPVVICPKSWQAGSPVILGVKLRVQNATEGKPIWLKHEDVPIEPALRATLTFKKGHAVLTTFIDVPVTPEC
ncbi:MAG: hypothetical protein EXS16_21555 [Gemmataceae bacterium]|nr:hypothetical protein [Gemmataceae bacterium]